MCLIGKIKNDFFFLLYDEYMTETGVFCNVAFFNGLDNVIMEPQWSANATIIFLCVHCLRSRSCVASVLNEVLFKANTRTDLGLLIMTWQLAPLTIWLIDEFS